MTQHETKNLPPHVAVIPNLNRVVPESDKASQKAATHTTPLTKREGHVRTQKEAGNQSAYPSVTANFNSWTADHLRRHPIVFFFIFYLIGTVIVSRWGDFLLESYHSVGSSATPLCHILPRFLCQENTDERSKDSSTVHGTPWAAKTKLEEDIFDHLMSETVGGVALSLQMKDAQMAISDLAVLVHGSDLRQKDMITKRLEELRNDAREVGGSLQKFARKVEGSLDSIVAVNDWALQSIQRARELESQSWFPRAFIPWRSTTTTNEVVLQTFHEAIYVLEQHLRRLILEAEVSELAIKSLDERMDNLRGILEREAPTKAIETVETETLEVLWFVAQHHSSRVIRHERDEELLKNLRAYAREASVHISTALKFLRETSAEMEDVRDRVAKPSLMGRSVPVEIHLQSISVGLERMELRRIGARNAEEEEIRRVMERRLINSSDIPR